MKKHKLTGEGGKGSARRSSQDDKKYADNWDKIFKQDKDAKNKEKTKHSK